MSDPLRVDVIVGQIVFPGAPLRLEVGIFRALVSERRDQIAARIEEREQELLEHLTKMPEDLGTIPDPKAMVEAIGTEGGHRKVVRAIADMIERTGMAYLRQQGVGGVLQHLGGSQDPIEAGMALGKHLADGQEYVTELRTLAGSLIALREDYLRLGAFLDDRFEPAVDADYGMVEVSLAEYAYLTKPANELRVLP